MDMWELLKTLRNVRNYLSAGDIATADMLLAEVVEDLENL